MRQPNDTTTQRPGRRRREEEARAASLQQRQAGSGQVDTTPRSTEGLPTMARTRDTWGRVDGFQVRDDGLVIKLNSGAISRSIVLVETDAPHFRAAVSITMLAYNASFNRGTTPDGESTDENNIVCVRLMAPDARGWETVTAIGLGRESLDLNDYIFRPEDAQRS